MTIPMTSFLRKTLLLDGIMSGGAGLLMVAGAGFLAPLLALPQPLLFWAGLVLLPWFALLVAVARRETAPRALVLDIAIGNGLWVIASFGILVTGIVSPNLLGTLFVVAQALAVALFTALQFAALRGVSKVAA